MKKLTITLLLLSVSMVGFSQATEGTITYKYTIFHDKIFAKMDFLSQSEKDRIKLTWSNEEGYTTKMQLFFNPTASLYTYAPESESEYSYSWRKDDYLIYRNLEEKKIKELQEMLGKTYLIEDDLIPYKWRVMNELKEVQGHLCMKAVTKDTVKNQTIAAWFAADIPVSVGPERLYGLPGIILAVEINDGDVLIEASNITIESVAEKLKLPRKMKGKEINVATYQTLIAEHIQISMTTQQYPFWSIRF